jgi:leader peptidase (prepilin peptidase)/N-methyltransferase
MEEKIAGLILGAILGSFLNAVIYRVPLRLSLWEPKRSFCPNCKKTLTWMENIPIVSYLMQGGKCRGCKTRIPIRYLIVEILAAIGGYATIATFGVTPTGVVIFALVLTLIAISFIDFDHKIIPDRISFPGMIIGLVLGMVSQYSTLFRCRPFQHLCPVTQGAIDSLAGFVAGGGFFWLIGWAYFAATKKDGLGFGDVKLMAMTGAILGIHSIAPTVILGSLSGAIVGVVMMVVTGGGRNTEIPFGPWLSLGAILYIFFNPAFFRLF